MQKPVKRRVSDLMVDDHFKLGGVMMRISKEPEMNDHGEIVVDVYPTEGSGLHHSLLILPPYQQLKVHNQ